MHIIIICVGKKESSKIIVKNTVDGKPPQAKRPRGKRTAGGGGCPFYRSTTLGSFSDLALVRQYVIAVYVVCMYTTE